MTSHDDDSSIFEEVADSTVAFANSFGERDEETDPWDVAAGLLAGAVQFWLFAHQPCEKPDCEGCAPISTAALRLKMLLDDVTQMAETSEYFHTPNDADAGHA